jgi:hypothetical protein
VRSEIKEGTETKHGQSSVPFLHLYSRLKDNS